MVILNYFYLNWRCPNTNSHDRASCVYAHNVNDYRREFKLFPYLNEECPLWNKSDNVKSYKEALHLTLNIY